MERFGMKKYALLIGAAVLLVILGLWLMNAQTAQAPAEPVLQEARG